MDLPAADTEAEPGLGVPCGQVKHPLIVRSPHKEPHWFTRRLSAHGFPRYIDNFAGPPTLVRQLRHHFGTVFSPIVRLHPTPLCPCTAVYLSSTLIGS